MRQTLGLVLFILISPLLLIGQGSPKRTLLLELKDVPAEKLNTGLLMFDEYRRDVVISSVRGTVLMLATKAESEVLRERGFRVKVFMEDTNQVSLYKRAIYGETMRMPSVYHTYERIIEEVDALTKQYPRIAKKIVIGETSQEKRNIYAVKISSDVDKNQDKPRILFNGCHHADEVMGAEICTAIIHELIEKYEKDPQVTDWVNRYEIFLVPVVNVDGHTVVTHGIDPRWRKNTRDTNGNGVLYEYAEGVDLNRNYDFNWAHGGSDDPMSERYRGPYLFLSRRTERCKALQRQRGSCFQLPITVPARSFTTRGTGAAAKHPTTNSSLRLPMGLPQVSRR